MAKVLEGNYADKGKGKKEIVPDWMKESQEQFNTYEDFLYESIQKKTAADNDEIRARAEALKKELGGTGHDRLCGCIMLNLWRSIWLYPMCVSFYEWR